MFTKEYWNARAQTYGHTGHAESFYYCFDQQARLYAINELIKTLPVKKHNVLDFGCGSGDFIEVLKPHFENIYAFDISEIVVQNAQKKFNQSNIIISDKLDQNASNNSFDLILTVTVLQTLKKGDLQATINLFNNYLSKNGVLLCMEFFRDDKVTGEYNEMKSTISEWKNTLAENKFRILSETSFYNPITNPIKSWYSYNTNLYLKILKPFKNSSFAKAKFTEVAKKLISQHKDVLLDTDTAFKIYVIQKENLCN